MGKCNSLKCQLKILAAISFCSSELCIYQEMKEPKINLESRKVLDTTVLGQILGIERIKSDGSYELQRELFKFDVFSQYPESFCPLILSAILFCSSELYIYQKMKIGNEDKFGELEVSCFYIIRSDTGIEIINLIFIEASTWTL